MYGVFSDTLVQQAAELISEHFVKKQCGLARLCCALDLPLSRARTAVAAMRQNCNTKLGRKRVQKKKPFIVTVNLNKRPWMLLIFKLNVELVRKVALTLGYSIMQPNINM